MPQSADDPLNPSSPHDPKPTPLRKAIDARAPVLDVVVIGARVEEQQALAGELARHSDDGETEKLVQRLRESDHGGGIPTFALRDRNAKRGARQTIGVGVVECSEMGNVAAAINTAYAICEYRPTLIVFSGIAGALDTKNMRIGDVICPRSITTRDFQKLKTFPGDYGALTEQDRAEALEFMSAKLHVFTKTISISERAKKVLVNLDVNYLESQLHHEPVPGDWVKDYSVPDRRPHYIKEEEGFSWNSVLSNKKYVEFLKNPLGNAWTSVEMESYGFLRAVEKVDNIFPTDGLVIRSISDFAQHKDLSDQDPRWRDLGLRNMAVATRCLLEQAFSKVY